MNEEKNTEIQQLYEKYTTDKKYRFLLKQLLETGLSLEANNFEFTREGKTFKSPYLVPDADGNVRFYVPDIITGDLEQYTYGQEPHVKIRDWYLTRWMKPKDTKEGPAKYTPVRGSGVRVLFTKPVVEAFKKKKQIKILFVIEGFKKALSGAENLGLPMVGINGLTGFKEPGESLKLRKEIREILVTCKVQQVVYMLDSDLFDLSSKKEKAATSRVNIFYRAVIMAKTLFEQFADVTLAYPNPKSNRKLGLDDLLLEHRNISKINSLWKDHPYEKLPDAEYDNQQNILKDLMNAIRQKIVCTHFTAVKISALADFKIKQLFHLDSVQSFYEYYRSHLLKLPNKRFQFYTHLYQIQADGTLHETEDEQHRNINIEVRFGKLVRIINGSPKELANFSIRVLFQIDSEDDPKRICEITNWDGKSRIIEITSKTFVSLSDFQALLISFGDFIWKGSKDDLLDLMTILFKHEKPALLLSQLGWQPLDGFYSFSNGIVTGKGFITVDEYGMVTHNEKNYYLPAWSKFNERDYDTYKDVKKFSHMPAKKPVSFLQWKSQFTKVFSHNGEIAVCFYISTLFSDIVFNHKSGIGFPLLWSAGKPKTGKSTICTSLLYLFGEPSDSIGLAGKSTIKYFINRFAQIRNGLLHLDEYSNTKVNKDVKETLKNIYDRIGYGRKAFSNDFRTLSTPILSAAMVSGEEIPTDNHALFTRAILLLFNKDKFTVKEREEFLKLADMEEAGLSHITVSLLSHRQLIEEEFDNAYTTVFNDFYEIFKTRQVDDRMLKNASWLVTSVKILIDHNKIDFGTPYKKLISAFASNIETQLQYLIANTDVAKFWDIIEMLINNQELSETKGDYKFMDDLIAVRVNRLHIPYAMEARKLGYEKILDKSTLQNYLANEPYHVELTNSNGKPKTVRFNNSSPTTAMFFRFKDIGIDFSGDKSFPIIADNNEDSEDSSTPPPPPLPESKMNKNEQKDLPF